jgi:hypothetical protein
MKGKVKFFFRNAALMAWSDRLPDNVRRLCASPKPTTLSETKGILDFTPEAGHG